MSNTDLWDRLGKTDPSQTKPFTRTGGFRGTAIKPMWAFRRMTEEFGACGTGWGVGEPSFQVVPGADGEVLVYCTVSAWHGTREQVVFGVGGDKVVGKNKHGLSSDDEAFKKAFTDALTNALKLIGVGADVHMGMFDDSKYVQSLRDESRLADTPPPPMAEKGLIANIRAADSLRGLEELKSTEAFRASFAALDDAARGRVLAEGKAQREALEQAELMAAG